VVVCLIHNTSLDILSNIRTLTQWVGRKISIGNWQFVYNLTSYQQFFCLQLDICPLTDLYIPHSLWLCDIALQFLWTNFVPWTLEWRAPFTPGQWKKRFNNKKKAAKKLSRLGGIPWHRTCLPLVHSGGLAWAAKLGRSLGTCYQTQNSSMGLF